MCTNIEDMVKGRQILMFGNTNGLLSTKFYRFVPIHRNSNISTAKISHLKVIIYSLVLYCVQTFISIHNISPYVIEIFTSIFTYLKLYETVYKVYSNSTTIGVGPHISTFRLTCLIPELWPT